MFGIFFRKKTGKTITDSDSISDLQKILKSSPFKYVKNTSNLIPERGNILRFKEHDDLDEKIKKYDS